MFGAKASTCLDVMIKSFDIIDISHLNEEMFQIITSADNVIQKPICINFVHVNELVNENQVQIGTI
ncbi:hypothetical protein T4D_10490 [Trichinella pseudospiralis]|uniref:Uncharacterized protein n=1 Tax=Trichinella pseudospiralis TaxID=6337 RepID=A0A0V1F8G8_TRIPS|nr:hypothetical protein T4D_10490 [Trichinella pseudospiralis]